MIRIQSIYPRFFLPGNPRTNGWIRFFSIETRGFCGLKSLGCLAGARETCASSRRHWWSRLQHLGLPHAPACWRQLTVADSDSENFGAGGIWKLGATSSGPGGEWHSNFWCVAIPSGLSEGVFQIVLMTKLRDLDVSLSTSWRHKSDSR